MTGNRVPHAKDKETPLHLFLAISLPAKLELLMKQRERLFHQYDELLQRQAVLIHERRELIERQTTYELQFHVFKLRLRQAASVEERDNAETSAPSTCTFTLPEFSARLLSGDTCPQRNCCAEVFGSTASDGQHLRT